MPDKLNAYKHVRPSPLGALFEDLLLNMSAMSLYISPKAGIWNPNSRFTVKQHLKDSFNWKINCHCSYNNNSAQGYQYQLLFS